MRSPWTADRFKAKHHDPISVLGPGVGVIITNVFHSFIHSFVSVRPQLCCRLHGPEACGILLSQQGIRLMSPALAADS